MSNLLTHQQEKNNQQTNKQTGKEEKWMEIKRLQYIQQKTYRQSFV